MEKKALLRVEHLEREKTGARFSQIDPYLRMRKRTAPSVELKVLVFCANQVLSSCSFLTLQGFDSLAARVGGFEWSLACVSNARG